jgi:hypothetical protein
MAIDDTKATKKSAQASKGFSAEERAAMRAYLKEKKASASREDGERDLLASIAAMSEPDRALGERLHALIMATAPDLAPRT